jgi:hypothetical protein
VCAPNFPPRTAKKFYKTFNSCRRGCALISKVYLATMIENPYLKFNHKERQGHRKYNLDGLTTSSYKGTVLDAYSRTNMTN